MLISQPETLGAVSVGDSAAGGGQPHTELCMHWELLSITAGSHGNRELLQAHLAQATRSGNPPKTTRKFSEMHLMLNSYNDVKDKLHESVSVLSL